MATNLSNWPMVRANLIGCINLTFGVGDPNQQLVGQQERAHFCQTLSLYTQARESPETDFRAHRRTATNFCAHRHTASPLARTESMDFQCLRLWCSTDLVGVKLSRHWHSQPNTSLIECMGETITVRVPVFRYLGYIVARHSYRRCMRTYFKWRQLT